MKYYLGCIEINWADEIDIEQTVIMNSHDIETLKSFCEKCGDRRTDIWIGTNECIEDISAKEVCDQFSYKEISKSTYEELKETGLMGMGLPMIIEKAIEDLEYEEDYEEDDE